MKKTKILLWAAVLGLLTFIAWVVLFTDETISKSNFEKIEVGMKLKDVESILGKAGPSYSSLAESEYYIWKGRNGWIRVWAQEGKVTKTEFDPELTIDDDWLGKVRQWLTRRRR
jgi:hypothetical protein